MKGNAAKFPSKREGKTHFTFPDVSSIGFDKKEGPPIDEIVGGNDVDPPRKYKVRRYRVPKSPSLAEKVCIAHSLFLHHFINPVLRFTAWMRCQSHRTKCYPQRGS